MTQARPLERFLAVLLQYGCYVASAVIVAGLAFAQTPWVKLGIGLFIVLPVLRVVAMLAAFLRRRDYRFSCIAAAVLTIIVLGYAMGLHLAGSPPP